MGNTKVVVKAVEKEPEVVNQAVTAAATGAKKVTVTFAKDLTTTSGVAITVKKGTVVISQKATTFADGKTANVELNQSLTSGAYTVEVTGLEEGTMTADFNVESDEYVAKIELTSAKAPMLGMNSSTTVRPTSTFNDNKRAKVSFVMKNQYDEVVSNAGQPQISVSTGVPAANYSYKNGEGSFEINTNATAFIPGDKVFLNIVLTSGTHVATMSDSVEIVMPSNLDTVDFLGVYDMNLKKLGSVSSAKLGTTAYNWNGSNKGYALLFTAKDQYGIGRDVTKIQSTEFSSVSTYPVFLSTKSWSVATTLDTVIVDEKEYAVLPLLPGSIPANGGTATVQIISSSTGTKSSYDVVADAAGAVKTFTLSSPSGYVVDGEKIEIPFSAVDQYGTTVTSYDAFVKNDGTKKVNVSSSYGTLDFVKQADGSAKLVLDLTECSNATATQDQPAYLTSVVQSNGNYSSASISAKNAAYPVEVKGLKASSDISTTVAVNAKEFAVAASDIEILDQYGRSMSKSDVSKFLGAAAGKYNIYAKQDTAKAVLKMGSTAGSPATGTAIVSVSAITSKIYFAPAGADGSEKITFGIAKNSDGTKDSSEKAITFSTAKQSEFVSYEMKALDKMYYVVSGNAITETANAAYAVTPTVYGVKADGSKVVLQVKDGGVSGGMYYVLSTDDSKGVIKPGTTTKGAIFQNDPSATAYQNNNFQVSSVDTTYADVKIKVTATIYNAGDVEVGSASQELLVSNKTPKVAVASFNDKVSDKKATVSAGAINTNAATAFKALLDNDTIKDQYGKKNSYENAASMSISKITDADVVDGFSVTNNGKSNVTMSNVSVKDTFRVTFNWDGGYSISVDIVAGN